MTWTAATLSSTGWNSATTPATAWDPTTQPVPDWVLQPPPPNTQFFFLLMAEGTLLLQEDGSDIELEGNGPIWIGAAIPALVWTPDA